MQLEFHPIPSAVAHSQLLDQIKRSNSPDHPEHANSHFYMKFDLGSTRNASACAAMGSILAQRALDDDIHDVVYTPRKGDRIEGKLHIDLQSIIDNGINVKAKLKQRRPKKTVHVYTT
ncbi:hypothetical protein F3Y22_tig00110195pilonHSYRG00218 [Hibiscus syriacus]|uniref:Uncharacterized protein n=1 Tax=Hibiscus syriacus TaxID=106335 RepID=A0A6A3BCF6_HIBSY|nr:hypothetical protein F3Y22_tig00110195pilonHSYRG00218 [Hibiscus syriacus]